MKLKEDFKMIFDVDAVKQLVRHYNGFYLVKGGCTEERLQYKTVKDNDCQVDIDCSLGEVTVTLQEEYRGRNSVTKKTLEYNYIHEVSYLEENNGCIYLLFLDYE